MITDIDLCDIAAAAYQSATIETADCHVLIIEREGLTIGAFRGTDPSKLIDLWRDADALMYDDPILGPVHDGFYWDVCSVAWRMPHLDIVVGHSKGGSEVLTYAGMLAAIDKPPSRLVTFGAARSGGPKLGKLIAMISGNDYWNGGDPIPLSSLNPRSVTTIGQHLMTHDVLGDHYLRAYRDSLSRIVA